MANQEIINKDGWTGERNDNYPPINNGNIVGTVDQPVEKSGTPTEEDARQEIDRP